MRIITDIPEMDNAAIVKICKKKGISRAEFLRQAAKDKLEAERRNVHRQKALKAGFGLWKGKLKVDALEYQRVVREGGDIRELFNE